MSYKLVESVEELESYCKKMSSSPVIAVDTEFKRENTYYPIACLIQLATDELTICVDPLTLPNINALQTLLYSSDIIKIFHAGRQDLEIFFHMFEELPQPIFDTQLAAALLGYPDQVGYANLVKQELNVELDKSQTRTDWEKRPFSIKQLEYAANDVIYLLSVYKNLTKRLKASNKDQWLNNDFNKLVDKKLYKPMPETAWKKVKNYSFVPASQRCIVYKLAIWREEEAIRRNKPRKFILTDANILDLANQNPQNVEIMENIPNLHKMAIKRYGSQLIDLINTAKNMSHSDCPKPIKKIPLNIEQKKSLEKLQKRVQAIAEENEIAPTTLCTRKELECLVRGENLQTIIQGWRYELLNSELQNYLSQN